MLCLSSVSPNTCNWSHQMTMLITVFTPLSLLFICCSVALAVGIAYFILRILMHVEYEICCTSTGKITRRLGSFERYFLTMASGCNIGYVTTVLLLESRVKLNKDHVKKALLMLSERFPLLRMRVTVNNCNQPCFEEMENPQSLDFQRRRDIDAGNWIHAFNEQLNCAPFNTEQGPLWRVTLLREICTGKGKERLYKNALLFTFHHVICDARSIFEFKDKLVQFLGVLYNGEDVEVETLPFRPSIERATKHLTKPNIREIFLHPIFLSYCKLRTMIRTPKMGNLYLSTFPPNNSYSLAQKTYVIPRSLTEKDTTALIGRCKANECTVHGAVTAATHLAMSQIIDPELIHRKTPLLIDSSYSVDIREECKPKIGREEFGLYISFDSLQVAVKGTDNFWDLARTCTNKVHRKIDSGEHRNVLKRLQCVNIPSMWELMCFETRHGHQKEVFNLTNLGVLPIDQDGKSPYKFSGSYLAAQTAQVCYVTGHNLFTVNDQLYWTVEYSPEIITESQAKTFVDLSLRVLMDACSS